MKRRDFFIQAMNAGKARFTNWVISIFAITRPLDYEQAEYQPYEVVRGKEKYSFWNPETNSLEVLEDSDASRPLFDKSERLTVQAGEVVNIAETMEITYARLFYNYVALVIPFGAKIPYSQIEKVEDVIAERLVGEETPPDQREGKILIDEYLLFTESALNLNSYTQLFTPAASRKSMTQPPWVKEYRAELYAKYAGQLHDPAVIAAIDKALVDRYREWLKGDVSENFFVKDKQISLNNKKKYLSYGAEPGIDGSVKLDPVPESLSEGWDFKKLPQYINTARAGSFNRGFQTRLGGEEFKWAVRNTINLTVSEDDCGTKLGIETRVTEANAKHLVGCYAIGEKGPIPITSDEIGKYVGKTLKVRSPMYCKLKGNNRCAKCCGDKLALSKTGLSAAITGISSGIMYIFMSAAHAKGIKVARLSKDAFI